MYKLISFGSKRARKSQLRSHSQQSNGRTFININDEPVHLEAEESPLSRLIGMSKEKKMASSSCSKNSEANSIDHSKDKFD